ncbi:hypothetical protein EMIT0P294_110059 [Pseudomonas sp. IT-P294]
MRPEAVVVSPGGSAPMPGMLFQHAGLQGVLLARRQGFFDSQRTDGKPWIEQLLPALTADCAVRPCSAKPAQLADRAEPATQFLGIAGIEKVTGGVRVVKAQQGTMMQAERNRQHASQMVEQLRRRRLAGQQQSAPDVRLTVAQPGEQRALFKIDQHRAVLAQRLELGAIEQQELSSLRKLLAQRRTGPWFARDIKQ